VETGGPYRWVRHPNYAVIGVELAALPLGFRMRKLAVFVTLANAGLLALRIREEEEALRALPGWDEHFGDKARFIPRVF
jgi:methyltransferase